MIGIFKECLEYRKNKKIAKRELAKIAATALPIIRETTESKANIVKFLLSLSQSTKGMEGKELFEEVLNKTAEVLKTSDNRLLEIASYMAKLTPQDVQNILAHSRVATMAKEENTPKSYE